MKLIKIIEEGRTDYLEYYKAHCRSSIWKRLISIGFDQECIGYYKSEIGLLFIAKGKRKYFAFYRYYQRPSEYSAYNYDLGEIDLKTAFLIIENHGVIDKKGLWEELKKRLVLEAI